MSSVATDLEWAYEPDDFFEVSTAFTLDVGVLTIEHGKACLRLQVAAEIMPAGLRKTLNAQVAGVFDARRLLMHRGRTVILTATSTTRRTSF